jgi:hypothetical protein
MSIELIDLISHISFNLHFNLMEIASTKCLDMKLRFPLQAQQPCGISACSFLHSTSLDSVLLQAAWGAPEATAYRG